MIVDNALRRRPVLAYPRYRPGERGCALLRFKLPTTGLRGSQRLDFYEEALSVQVTDRRAVGAIAKPLATRQDLFLQIAFLEFRRRFRRLYGLPTSQPCGFCPGWRSGSWNAPVHITALQGIYPAFSVTGGIRQHLRCGKSSARCCVVDA